MTRSASRRDFLKTASAATLAALSAGAPKLFAQGPLEKITPTADTVIVLWMAGGMAHDLAGLFARGAWFPVIASASTVAERAPAELGRDVGRRLGARFVVDGTLCMDERQFRLAVHIDDVDDGCCLWAERFDFPHAALFAVQDEICLAIVAAGHRNKKRQS